MSSKPRDLLDEAIDLMAQELAHIRMKIGTQLDSESSSALRGYSKALLDIVKEEATLAEAKKKKLGELTNEELLKMIEEQTSLQVSKSTPEEPVLSDAELEAALDE